MFQNVMPIEIPIVLLRFVIKKHASRYLHFDFRIEVDGVLISFVIYFGPSIDPDVPRRAIRVDDHSLEYLDSERQIPEGHYGAGTVMVWDIGMWLPLCKNPAKALQKGRIEFMLFGARSRGKWALVRVKGPQWQLIKIMDEHAQLGNPDALVGKYKVSATTGRTMEEIRDYKPWKKNQDDQGDLWTGN